VNGTLRHCTPEDALRALQLSECAAQYPYQLSGGQLQRVQLARALASGARYLILDEPTSSLDRPLADALYATLRDVAKQQQVGILIVTHDLLGAIAAADRVLLATKVAGEPVRLSPIASFGGRLTMPATLLADSHFVASYGAALEQLNAQSKDPSAIDHPAGREGWPRRLRRLGWSSLKWAGALLAYSVVLEVGVRLFFPRSQTIVGPWGALQRLPTLVHMGLIGHLWATLLRTTAAFVLASVIGVAAGVLLGRRRRLKEFCTPLIDLLRPLPSSAVIPVFMMAMGFETRTYLVAIVYGAVWPILIGTIDGVQYVDRTIALTMRQLRLPKTQMLWQFVLPEAAPEIMTGLRVSLAIALILAITAELLINMQSGLGLLLTQIKNNGDYPGMYLCLFILALLGFTFNQGLRALEARIPWLKHRYPAA
jgi:ABC-type nitrate/sulfonate/bicarbonate transport system permease component